MLPSPRRRRPPSPSLPSTQGAPPPVRRRLFSTPLQPLLHDPPPPPRHTLSFKVKSDPTSKSLLPPPCHVLSFKISGTNTSWVPTFNAGSEKGMLFMCVDTSHFLTYPSTTIQAPSHPNYLFRGCAGWCPRRGPGRSRRVPKGQGGLAARLFPAGHSF